MNTFDAIPESSSSLQCHLNLELSTKYWIGMPDLTDIDHSADNCIHVCIVQLLLAPQLSRAYLVLTNTTSLWRNYSANRCVILFSYSTSGAFHVCL